ncbi:hypothetical protein ACVWYG_001165 [Pedobacter sp. UYEF25]
MKKFRKVIPTVLISIMFSACSNGDVKSVTQHLSSKDRVETVKDEKTEINQELLLLPGVAAGKVKLGQDAKEVYALLGKADAGDAAMQKSVSIWYKNHDPESFAIAIYTVRDTADNPAARIQQVRVSSPEFKTEEGIGASSSLEKIKQKYSVTKLTDDSDGDEVLVIYDSMAGIAFETYNGICKAVIIHRANESLKSTSLPLHQKNL